MMTMPVFMWSSATKYDTNKIKKNNHFEDAVVAALFLSKLRDELEEGVGSWFKEFVLFRVLF